MAQSSLLLPLSSLSFTKKTLLKNILPLDSFLPPFFFPSSSSLFYQNSRQFGSFSYRGSGLFLETPEEQLHSDKATGSQRTLYVEHVTLSLPLLQGGPSFPRWIWGLSA